MCTQLLECALTTFDQFAAPGAVESLAVDAHARRDNESLDRALCQRFEQHGGTLAVGARVVGNFVHALADAHNRGEMKHRVDVLECARHCLGIAHVAANEFHFV